MEAAETGRTDESQRREWKSPKLLFIRARKPLLPGAECGKIHSAPALLGSLFSFAGHFKTEELLPLWLPPA